MCITTPAIQFLITVEPTDITVEPLWSTRSGQLIIMRLVNKVNTIGENLKTKQELKLL